MVLDRERAPERIVVLVATAVYVVFAAQHVVGVVDAAEMAALGAHGGVAHPSGYPLYILLLRALSWLPTSYAHAAALTDALLGGISVAALQWACRSWGASRTASAVVSALYALSPLAWEQATLPDVFVLNVALALGIVAVAGPVSLPSLSGEKRVALLGLLAGLGLSNQLTIVLVAPVGLLAAVQAARRSRRPAFAVAVGLAGLVAGLLPYGYLLIATKTAPAACVWSQVDDVRSLVRNFLRLDYGATKLSATKEGSDRAGQEWLLLGSYASSLLWLPLLSGAPFLSRRPRMSMLSLVATAIIVGPLFVLVLNTQARDEYAIVARRFHLLGLALVAVLAALSLTHLLARSPRWGPLSFAFAFLLAVVRISWVAMSPRTDPPTLEQYTANVFGMLPPSSILLLQRDASNGAFLYAQCAEGLRPDVTTIVPRRLFAESYRQRIRASTGISIEPDAGHLRARDVLAAALATGRPVYVTEWFAPGLDGEFLSYPIGPLIRLVAAPDDMLDPLAVLRANEEVFSRFTLETPRPAAGTQGAAYYRDYARPWQLLAGIFGRYGRTDLAGACTGKVDDLAPSPGETFFGGVTE